MALLYPELYSLIVGYLQDDTLSLKACSLASRPLCRAVCPHLFRRLTYAVDVNEAPMLLLLQAGEHGRLMYIEELVLVRKEPAVEEVSTDIAGKKKGKGTRTGGVKGRTNKGQVTLAVQAPNAPTPPSEGHLNIQTLYNLLGDMPRIRSLTITRLHIVPGPSFPILRHHCLEELSFRGLDTGNAFYTLLPLFSTITKVTISDHWNALVVPMGPVRLPETFPYSLEPHDPLRVPLKIDTLKICACMPKVVHYWCKALRVFTADDHKLKRLMLDESMLLFQEDRPAVDAALREICESIERIDLDLESNRPMYLGPGVMLPCLRLASSLTTIRIHFRANKNSFRAAQKFVLSTRNHENNTTLLSLREIHLSVIFKHARDRYGRPETAGAAIIRLSWLGWDIIENIVKAIGWRSGHPLRGVSVHVKIWDAPKDEGGKVWMKDELPDVLGELLSSEVLACMQYE